MRNRFETVRMELLIAAVGAWAVGMIVNPSLLSAWVAHFPLIHHGFSIFVPIALWAIALSFKGIGRHWLTFALCGFLLNWGFCLLLFWGLSNSN